MCDFVSVCADARKGSFVSSRKIRGEAGKSELTHHAVTFTTCTGAAGEKERERERDRQEDRQMERSRQACRLKYY